MRTLQAAAADGDRRAELAITMFAERAAAAIAAMSTSLGRLDAIVFTGGIGEHAVEVRRRILARLAPLGVSAAPDDTGPGGADARLDGGTDGVAVLRIEAREDLVIADLSNALVEGLSPAH
jgi:acetate kinase